MMERVAVGTGSLTTEVVHDLLRGWTRAAGVDAPASAPVRPSAEELRQIGVRVVKVPKVTHGGQSR